jgi:pyruvate dehydrogenase E2 component (dihydrolipoyllysine-residue acetyltransferase)
METQVILPALGMAQETGIIVRWLKAEGQEVTKGEPLVEIETDKATVEIEASASGILTNVTGAVGIEIPVGQVIASIIDSVEISQENSLAKGGTAYRNNISDGNAQVRSGDRLSSVPASPLAVRIATEHNLDLETIKPSGKRIQSSDVLAHIQERQTAESMITSQPRLVPASPKARRLAAEQGRDLATIQGSGPGGAVLVADVQVTKTESTLIPVAEPVIPVTDTQKESAVSHTWRVMAERTTQSWTSVPHFYLVREVNASRLMSWREHIQKRSTEKVTYTDLLIKVLAATLREHPRLNASWHAGSIIFHEEINMGFAVAVDEGLIVPVIHRADEYGVQDLAQIRKELITRAQAGKLRPQDIQGGTFTISNLGMYGVDAFNAIINPPQAAILSVGRIAERVVPISSQPSVQPMMVLSLSCDHRVVDGARGAQFLATLADLVEEPLGLLG